METKTKINALIDSKKKAYTREDLKEIVLILRQNMSFEQISKETGIAKTTLFNYTKPQTVKILDRDELSRIIIFFDDFIPQGKDVDRVKKLINHLIELVS